MGPASPFGPIALKSIALMVATGLLLLVGLLAGWLWTPDRPRAELERLYLAAPTDLIELAGMRLHVRDSGP